MHGSFGLAEQPVRRVIRRHNDWTLKEHEVMVSHWPDVEAIRHILPHRTVRAIRAFAIRCNLTTSRHVWTTAEEAKLRKFAAEGRSRIEMARELGLSPGQVAGRLSNSRIRIAQRPPTSSRNPLVNAVRLRAFDLKMSLADLDRSIGNRRIFQNAAGNQKVAHIHIERAVRALGGKLAIEWCEE